MWHHALVGALLASRAAADMLLPVEAPEMGDVMAIAPEAAVAPAPERVRDTPDFVKRDPNNPWPNCEQSLMQTGGNGTHSIMDILDSGAVDTRNRGRMPPRFLEIVEMVDDETMAILEGFNLTGDGYTLVVPKDEAFVYSPGMEPNRTDLFELYGIRNLTQPLATAIVRAHLIPDTINWNDLALRLRGNGTATYTSLEGYEWKVRYEGPLDGEYPVVIDKTNRTGLGFYELNVDIQATDAGNCPNTVWLVEGFIVGPNDLGPIVDPNAMPPAGAAPGPLPGGPATAGSAIPPDGAGAESAPGTPDAAGGAGPSAPGTTPGEEATGDGASGAMALLSTAAAGAAALAALLL